MSLKEVGIFHPKSADTLRRQVDQVSKYIGTSIVPPSIEHSFLDTPTDELKERFPNYYSVYLQSLIALGRKEDEKQQETKEMVKRWESARPIRDNLQKYLQEHHLDINGKTLRERQVTVFEDLRDFVEDGGREGYIKLPTGTGKTVLFTEFIEATNLKTLIVVPTNFLVTQTGNKLKEFAPDVNFGRIDKYAKEHGKQVTITTYNSFTRDVENGTVNPADYELLILDEAHKSLSGKRKNAVQRFTNAIKLGFTATPAYSKDKQLSELLNTEIHTMTIREAIEERLLSPVSVYIAQTEIDLTNVKITSTREYNQDELEKAINVEARNKAAVDLYQQMFTDQTTVAYCNSINHAENLARLFKDRGIAAEVISGKQSRDKQEELLEKFHNGEVKILCNADILIEGFDEQRVSVCLNLRPTLSTVVAEQRGGRTLRLDENNPDKQAYIVDFIDRTTDRKNLPVTFAQVAEGAKITTNSTTGFEGIDGGNGTSAAKTPSPEIKIEGLTVITDAEEVMRIMQEMISQKYQPAPEGWIVLGENKLKNTLCNVLNKSYEWVKPRLQQVLKRINEEQEEREELFGEYLDKSGRLYTFYSPIVINLFRKLAEQVQVAPKGWMTIGQMGEKNSLSGALNKANKWVQNRLPEVIKQIQKEYEEKGTSIEEREQLCGEFLDQVGRSNTFYSPIVFDQLKKLTEQFTAAPEGWMIVGTKKLKNALSHILNKDGQWIESRLPQVIDELQKEQEEKRGPQEEREGLFGEYLDLSNRPNMFYAPSILSRLKKLAEQFTAAPEGWKPIGTSKAKHTLAGSSNRGQGWIESHLPQAIKQIQKEWEESNNPVEKREQLYGEFLDTMGHPHIFYSPIVEDRLKELAKKFPPPPQKWLTIGNSYNKNTLSSILGKHQSWIRSHLSEVIETIRINQESQGIPPEKQQPSFGKYQGKTVITDFYSPQVLEALREIAEKEEREKSKR